MARKPIRILESQNRLFLSGRPKAAIGPAAENSHFVRVAVAHVHQEFMLFSAQIRRWPMCPMPRRSFRIAAIRAWRSIFIRRVADMRTMRPFDGIALMTAFKHCIKTVVVSCSEKSIFVL